VNWLIHHNLTAAAGRETGEERLVGEERSKGSEQTEKRGLWGRRGAKEANKLSH
jgi:hypothetical protein